VYEFLKGRPVVRKAAGLVLDVGGVGYDLAVPVGARFADEAELVVWTHLVVREDAHSLYGFPDQSLRDLFRLLLSVRGVGPAMALGILSSLSSDDLLDALAEQDLARLIQVKGVGKKTAEQILLDLRDRATPFLANRKGQRDPDLVPRPEGRAATNIEDAVSALVSIGFKDKEARRNVERAAGEVDPEDLERLVRAALSS